jgi:hypothetical protein
MDQHVLNKGIVAINGEIHMDYVLDGYCGIYCGACPVILATMRDEPGDVEPCHGCKSQKPAGFCYTCEIKACARNKGYDFCVQCNGLTTCEFLKKLVSNEQYPYGQCVFNNMQVIRDEGLPKWLEMQEKRWSCTFCGETHSWYQGTCQQCGKAVENYLADL